MKFHAIVAGALVSLAAAGVIVTPTARACGLFACDRVTLTPIVQSGERVLFIRHKGHTTMHVEVSYQGEPTTFGWLLPVPTRPVLEDGTPAPLEQIVRVSSQAVFDRLTEFTAPRFGLDRRMSGNASACYGPPLNASPSGDIGCNWWSGQFGAACTNGSDCMSGFCVAHPGGQNSCTRLCGGSCPPSYECGAIDGGGAPDAGGADSSDAGADASPAGPLVCIPTGAPTPQQCSDGSSGGGSSGGGGAPQLFPSFSEVKVLATADVGPYDAELIEASDAGQLWGWLAFNGYYQDPAALPIVEDYVALGYHFIGIKLQNTKAAGDMLPLALTFGENAPCLPLRLTAAAAAPAMPIDIWVLGDARAIPKNFLHAVVNERAVSYPSGDGYQEAVNAGIGGIGGRAWITEFADLASSYRGSLLPYPDETVAALTATLHLLGLIDLMTDYGVPVGAELARIARDLMPKPEGLRGYPNGICPAGTPCTDTNADHITTDDEYYDNLRWWAAREQSGGRKLGGDFAGLRARVIDELINPLLEVESYLNEEYVLTRFFTRINPEAMLRDPLFAFNADLPMVPRDRVAEGEVVVDLSCKESIAVTYPSGASGPSISCPGGKCGTGFTVAADASASPLEAVQVLDESGGPLNIDPSEAAGYDEFLASAVPGIPTVGSGAVQNPPLTPGKSTGPTGCHAASPWTAAWLAILGLAALALVRRRRSRAAL
jgi:MYXO-CTERM domain-containing protein